MGKEILRTNRIVQFTNLFKSIAEGIGSSPEFIASLFAVAYNGDLKAAIDFIFKANTE